MITKQHTPWTADPYTDCHFTSTSSMSGGTEEGDVEADGLSMKNHAIVRFQGVYNKGSGVYLGRGNEKGYGIG